MGISESEDARCSRCIKKYPKAYFEGQRAFNEGLDSSSIPYPQGTKSNRDKRVAWYSGYYGARTEQWEKNREDCRNHSNSS